MAQDRELLMTATKALKLDDDLALLEALATTVRNWQALANEIDGALSFDAFLDRLSKDLTSGPVVAAFGKLGLDAAHGVLRQFLGKLTDASGKIPAKYKALLSPLSAFAPGDARARVAWEISQSGAPVDKPDRYRLELGASAEVAFDAAGGWAEVPAIPRLLKLSASGMAKAAGSAKAPFALAGIGGSARAGLTYYFNPGDVLYAAAVAERLGKLPNPFDFEAVWNAFATSDLQGFACAFDGAANATVDIAFADAGPLALGLVGDLGVQVGVRAKIKSAYVLTVVRKPGGGEGAFSVRLARDRLTEAGFSGALAVAVDVSALTKPAVAALTRAIGQWDAGLEAIKPYLSPGTWLQKRVGHELDDGLAKLVKRKALREALSADLHGALGLEPATEGALAKWLSGQVAGAIDRSSALVNGQVDKAVDRVVDNLQSAIPSFMLADAEKALRALIADQLGKAEAALKEEAGKLLDQPSDLLTAALKKAGLQVNGAVKTLNDALKVVRDLLDHYDTLLQRMLVKAREAAEEKIKGRLFVEETRARGVVVELTGAFVAEGPAAGQLYRSISLGDLDDLARLLDGETQAQGFELDAAESSIIRFSKYQSRQGLEVSFLKVLLSAAELIGAEAAVKLDGEGNVHVDSRGNLQKTLETPFSDRSVSFTDTHALVLSAATPDERVRRSLKLDLSVGAAFADKNLKWTDIEDFVGRLQKASLVAPAAVGGARRAFDEWSAAAGGSGKLSGSISASLKLNGAQLEALLQRPARIDGNLPDEAAIRILETAMLALESGKGFDAAQFRDGATNAAQVFISSKTAKPAEIVLRHRRPGVVPQMKLPPLGSRPDILNTPVVFSKSQAQQAYVYFLGQAFALLEFVDFIDAMGDIYEAAPRQGGTGTWKAANYRDAQLRLVRDTRNWLTVFANLGNLFNSKVTPRTVAFLRASATLAGLDPGKPGGVTLSLTHHPETGPPETRRFE